MFCRNTSGILRWQHSSMKCAPFCALSLNKMPLLAMMPTAMPSMRAKPHDQGVAVARLEFVERTAIHDAGDDLAHVEGLARVDGDHAIQLVCYIFRSYWRCDRPGASACFLFKLVTAPRASVSACRSFCARWSATPDRRVCTSPPPRSSLVTTSPVAAFTSGGPPRKMVPWFLTMMVSSLMAGT